MSYGTVSHSAFLSAYVNFEFPREVGEGLVKFLRHQSTRRLGFSNYGNVPTHYCKLFQVLLRSPQTKQWFHSELLLAFTVPWWTTGGISYGSPCCTVVIGGYISLPSAWYA